MQMETYSCYIRFMSGFYTVCLGCTGSHVQCSITGSSRQYLSVIASEAFVAGLLGHPAQAFVVGKLQYSCCGYGMSLRLSMSLGLSMNVSMMMKMKMMTMSMMMSMMMMKMNMTMIMMMIEAASVLTQVAPMLLILFMTTLHLTLLPSVFIMDAFTVAIVSVIIAAASMAVSIANVVPLLRVRLFDEGINHSNK